MTTNQAVNQVVAGSYAFVVTGHDRPFSNDFVVLRASVEKYRGKNEVICYVKCTETSNEPGRIYVCAYSTKGKLKGCDTVN